MSYVAITYDGHQIRLADEQVEQFQEAMEQKRTFRFKGEIIQGADIRRIEKLGEDRGGNYASRLPSDFEKAALLLDAGKKPADPKERAALIEEIRAKVANASTEMEKNKAEYAEAVRKYKADKEADPEGFRKRQEATMANLLERYGKGEA